MSVEFKDAPGLPQRVEEKARAKAESKKAKQVKKYQEIFTELDGKVLKVTAKPNGAYSIFLAKKPKTGKIESAQKLHEYNALIADLKKSGKWVDSSSYEEKITELIAKAG